MLLTATGRPRFRLPYTDLAGWLRGAEDLAAEQAGVRVSEPDTYYLLEPETTPLPGRPRPPAAEIAETPAPPRPAAPLPSGAEPPTEPGAVAQAPDPAAPPGARGGAGRAPRCD